MRCGSSDLPSSHDPDLPLCPDCAGGRLYNGKYTAIADPIHLKAVVFSLEIAVGCTLLCILLSYPLVLALRRLNLGKRGFAIFIIILPMWMNFILRLLAWQMILSSNGILNFIVQKLGFEPLAWPIPG